MQNISCRKCGSTFRYHHQGRRYCDHCRRQIYLGQQRAKVRKKTKTCSDCGQALYAGRGGLDNPTCRACRRRRRGANQTTDKVELKRLTYEQYKASRSTKPCQECGQLLSKIQVLRRCRFCSYLCSAAHMRNQRPPRSTADCQQCGQTFTVTKDRRHYCSRSCFQTATASPQVSRWVSYVVYSTCSICQAILCGRRQRDYCKECQARSYYLRNPDRFKEAAHRRRTRVQAAQVEHIEIRKVFERDKWTCHICGNKVRRTARYARDPEMASLDHLVPIALGGEHSYANVACSHLRCNLRKHTKATGEQLMIVGMA